MIAVGLVNGYWKNYHKDIMYECEGSFLEELDEQTVSVKRGVFVWDNDGTIKETDILKPCYVKDERTVTITADGSSVAGIILEVADDGVTVDMIQQIITVEAAKPGTVTQEGE